MRSSLSTLTMRKKLQKLRLFWAGGILPAPLPIAHQWENRKKNRTTEEATRTNLIQAGLPNKWWPLAGKHACFMRNVCSEDADGKTAWEKRHKKGKFKGKKVTFGAAIHFLAPKPLQKRLMKWDSRAVPGIFLGYHLLPGGIWKDDYLVAPMSDFQKKKRGMNKQRKLPNYRVKEIVVDFDNDLHLPSRDGIHKVEMETSERKGD